MKILKVVLIVLGIVLGGYAIWMATLDGKYNVQRSVVINATPEVVYAEVSDFKTWPTWTSWFAKDSTMTTTFSEPSSGVGAWYTWDSKDGKGRMDIINAEANASIQSTIEFEGMGSSNINWYLKPVDGGTEATWTMEGEMPFFFRWMAKSMDEGIGPDYEESLANLKANLESRKPSYTFSEMNLQPMDIYYTHHEIAISAMNKEWYEAEIGKLTAYLGDDMANVTGALMEIYTYWNEDEDKTIFDLAFPVASTKPGNGVIMKGQSPAGKHIKTTHFGSYEGMGEAHDAMGEYFKANNLEMGEEVMSVYSAGPNQHEDPADYMTEIYYSVKQPE